MNTEPATAHELIAQGRKEEALRMTRRILSRRFGGVDTELMQALEQRDAIALEDMVVDIACAPALTYEHLRVRLLTCSELSAPSPEEGAEKRPPHRVAPLGGYWNTSKTPPTAA